MAGYKGIEEPSEAESPPSGGSAAAISHTVSLSYTEAVGQGSRMSQADPVSGAGAGSGGLKKMNLPE